jgi:hypothetical protein
MESNAALAQQNETNILVMARKAAKVASHGEPGPAGICRRRSALRGLIIAAAMKKAARRRLLDH